MSYIKISESYTLTVGVNEILPLFLCFLPDFHKAWCIRSPYNMRVDPEFSGLML
jgi:hypothetical protein